MEQAPDLKQLYLRTYEVFQTGDVALFADLLSQQPDVVMIGTDPAEWWTDRTAMAEVIQAQVALVQHTGLAIVPGDIQAYRAGSVGWVIDRPRFRLPDGTETTLRATAIFEQEHGAWKMVHGHYSIGVPNAEVPGFAGLAP
jgi:ketosteroid isomerase-like protein